MAPARSSNPHLVRVGNRIVNLNAVRYIDIEGPNLVNAYLNEQTEVQFTEEEAQSFLRLISDFVTSDDR
jgi:hypothetical protein